MSQQSLFIVDPTSLAAANVTATGSADGGASLQSLNAQYNSSAPTLTDGALSFLQLDVNGNLKTTATLSPSFVAADNAALPPDAAWLGASDGTNLQGLEVESSTAANLKTALYYGATEMIIGLDGYTAVHQAGAWSVGVTGTVAVTQSTSPWVVSGTVTANAGTGNFNVVGTGTAGSPAGGVLTVQGDPSGTPIPITGTISADNSSVGATGSAVPADATFIGASDGVNLRGLMVESSSAKNLRTGLFYGATQMIIENDGYTGVHQIGTWNVGVTGTVAVTQSTSPWVVSGTVTANAGTGTFDVNVTNASLAVSQSGTWTVQQGTPPWVITGEYAPNVAAGSDASKVLPAQFHATGSATGLTGPVDGYRFAGTAVTDGNLTYSQTDGYGRLEVSGARAVAYAYENRTNQTITLKNTAGVLRKVIVGNAGAAGALLTFYDNTSAAGTVIAKINTSSILGQMVFDIPFAVGLTYTTNNKNPGDITLTFE